VEVTGQCPFLLVFVALGKRSLDTWEGNQIGEVVGFLLIVCKEESSNKIFGMKALDMKTSRQAKGHSR